ncbi:hypothetical protein SAMN04488514_106139 [Kriegella aquimaris]|uniref:Uncharacterized protein n=2 Tax=Kriegella aquimaris TaxID=192904 RepID=A0A1G9RGW8_9FLAO|nr:hypothetical protein SAMN04488514_106139 [Kriegella aquimaris]
MKSVGLIAMATILLNIPVQANTPNPMGEMSSDVVTVLKDNLSGGWAYSVAEAPEGYEKGFLLIFKEGDSYKVQVQVGNMTMLGENVSVKKNTISFEVQVEGENVSVVLTADGSKISGTSTSSAGVLKINGTKSLSAG